MTILHVIKYAGHTRIDQEPYFPKWFLAELDKWRDALPGWPSDEEMIAKANKLLLEYDPDLHGEELHQ